MTSGNSFDGFRKREVVAQGSGMDLIISHFEEFGLQAFDLCVFAKFLYLTIYKLPLPHERFE